MDPAVCPYKRQKRANRGTDTWKEDPMRTGRFWSDAATTQGTPGATRSWEEGGILFPRAFRGSVTLETL